MSNGLTRRDLGHAGMAMVGTFMLTLATGVLSQSVNSDITAFHDRQANPKRPELPAHIYRASMADATSAAPSASPAPKVAPAWFPENNRVDWKLAIRPDQTPIGLSVRNASTQHNRILRFYLRAPGYSQMIPAADLYIRPSKEAELRLPPGQYLIQQIETPIDMPFDRVVQAKATNLAQVLLASPDRSRYANLRLTVHPRNVVTAFRLDTRESVDVGNAVANPIMNGPIAPIQYASAPAQRGPVYAVSSTQAERAEPDYSSLMRQALGS